ncbi:hypothetical protein ABW20_dc0110283 [Dactylellina cionopaga]|nr:hypothetical protein ABW20_dc0110283 [Dactylellina cionopaga]
MSRSRRSQDRSPERSTQRSDGRPLPPGWMEVFDQETSRYFYVDTNLKPWKPYWDHPADIGYDPEIFGRRFTVRQVIEAREEGLRVTNGASWVDAPLSDRSVNPWALERSTARTARDSRVARVRNEESDGDEIYSDEEDTEIQGPAAGDSPADDRIYNGGRGRSHTNSSHRRVYSPSEIEAISGYLTPRVLQSRQSSPAPPPPPPYSTPSQSRTHLPSAHRGEDTRARTESLERDSGIYRGTRRGHNGEEEIVDRSQRRALSPPDSLELSPNEGYTRTERVGVAKSTTTTTNNSNNESTTRASINNSSSNGSAAIDFDMGLNSEVQHFSSEPRGILDRLCKFLHIHVPSPAERDAKRQFKAVQRERKAAETARLKQSQYEQRIAEATKYTDMMWDLNRREREIFNNRELKDRLGFDEDLFRSRVMNRALRCREGGDGTASRRTRSPSELPNPRTPAPMQSPPLGHSYNSYFPSIYQIEQETPDQRRRRKIIPKTPPYLGSDDDLPGLLNYSGKGGIYVNRPRGPGTKTSFNVLEDYIPPLDPRKLRNSNAAAGGNSRHPYQHGRE